MTRVVDPGASLGDLVDGRLEEDLPSVYRRSQVPEGLILPLSMSVRGKRFVFTE
jgi:hypothetical protein